ncbi:hypothetical protein [Rhizorhabdus argentea]|uniref:hypothetical protein n=1 Tax=Rhizorhabdus argentea TaxID=1387174 RepID=UPI0030EF0604
MYRPAFEAALRLFAEVSDAMRKAGLSAPILVGGAAVELYSGSAIVTGDFDLVTARQEAFEEILQSNGFVRPSGPGMATRGWVHPALKLGFEIVSDRLLDGNADRSRVRLLDAGDGKHFAVISIEDLIADRMGQYASGTARDLLEQARTLYKLSERIDRSYLDRRIREETAGEYGIDILHEG